LVAKKLYESIKRNIRGKVSPSYMPSMACRGYQPCYTMIQKTATNYWSQLGNTLKIIKDDLKYTCIIKMG
jgi:hypothetical protein